MTQFLLPRSSG